MEIEEHKKGIIEARLELEQTLNAIEDKLNVPKQAKLLAENAKQNFKKDPRPWYITAAVVAAVAVGTVVLLIAKKR